MNQRLKGAKSFRTKGQFFYSWFKSVDSDRTVSQRSEPISRTILIGEQPNPWNNLQFQEMMRRHRGAKQPHQ